MIEYENLYKSNQSFFEEYKEAFEKILNSGWFILGDHVKEFEKNFSLFVDTRYTVGVASGLDALTLSLIAADLTPGQEVIVPSNSFIATYLSILHAKLTPVLVEPDPETYTIDTAKIMESITPKTGAIIAVHLYGKCCNMEALENICKNHNLQLIEDCAQAHGAKFKNQMAGSFGDMGAFSFYPTKNLGALGDGGAITTNNSLLEDQLKMLRNYGSKKKYHYEVIGFNSRLDELQAAFLNIKLRKLERINEHKRTLAQMYLNHLKDDFIKPVCHPDFYDVYHIFTIRHMERNKLREYLLRHDIKTEIHYPVPPHLHPPFEGIFAGLRFPISEETHRTTLSLPISYYHTPSDIEKVIEVLNRF